MATALHAYPTFKVNDDCNIFLERLDNAFYVSKTADTDKVPILLNQIDDVVYKVLHGLCMPDSPTVKSFDVLCTLLRRHYVREVCAWKMRQQFLTARQRSNENVNAWLARLRDMSARCEFGDEQDLMLCCVFVTGMKWHTAAEKIAEINAGAEIEELVAIAQTFEEESAKNRGRARSRAKSVEKVLDDEKNGLHWSETVPVTVVCAVCGISGHMGLQCPYKDQISAAQEPLKSGPICFSCGEPNHNFSKCVHKNSYCNYCHEMGHLETVCRHLNQHVQRGGGVHQPVSGVPQPRGVVHQPRGAAHQPEGNGPYLGGGSHQSRREKTPVEDRTRSQSRPNRPKRMCPHCGETDHSFDTCSARLMTCHNCDQVGHLARVCSYEEQEAKPKATRNRKKQEKQQDDLCCIC